MVYTLVVVVYGHSQQLLRPVLTYYILVQKSMDLGRLLQRLDLSKRLRRRSRHLVNIALGHLDTIGADACIHTLKQNRYFVLSPAAEHAVSAVFV